MVAPEYIFGTSDLRRASSISLIWGNTVISDRSSTFVSLTNRLNALRYLTDTGPTADIDNFAQEHFTRFGFQEDRSGVAGRERYVQKTFSTSIHRASGSFIPEDSGSYSILDVATGETIIPFSAYTSMSCDSTSNYFNQWMDGFEPDRYYKILIKVKYDDKQEQIFDDNFEFKVKR